MVGQWQAHLSLVSDLAYGPQDPRCLATTQQLATFDGAPTVYLGILDADACRRMSFSLGKIDHVVHVL
jgi:hypothetical protein